MGKLKNTNVIRKYHYLIRPICDLDNSRAREFISTCLDPKIDGWEIIALMGYSEKEVNNYE